MNNEGCQGCKEAAIAQRNQQTLKIEEAEKYTNEKKVNTVVYFDGECWQFCEETAAAEIGATNIIALFTPRT